MTVLSVNAHIDGATGEWAELGRKRYTVPVLVETNDKLDCMQTVMSAVEASGYTYGSPYNLGNDYDESTVLKRMVPKRLKGSRLWWMVMAYYSEPEEVKDDGEPTEDPLEKHAEVRIGTAQFTEECVEAYFEGPNAMGRLGVEPGDFVPVTNAAGDKPQERLEMDRSDQVIYITKNFATFDQDFYKPFRDCLNADEIEFKNNWHRYEATWAPLEAKIQNIGGEFVFEGNFRYWRVTAEIHLREGGWFDYIPNRGRTWLATDGIGGFVGAAPITGQMVNKMIRARTGETVGREQWLTMDGEPDQNAHTGAAAGVMLKYRKYEKRSFAPLGFDS